MFCNFVYRVIVLWCYMWMHVVFVVLISELLCGDKHVIQGVQGMGDSSDSVVAAAALRSDHSSYHGNRPRQGPCPRVRGTQCQGDCQRT